MRSIFGSPGSVLRSEARPHVGIVLASLLAGPLTAEAQTVAGPRGLRDYRAATLVATGDADRGRRLWEDQARTRCAGCHSVGVAGPTIGPDLSGLGGGRANPGEILDSILEPSARVHPDYASTVVALASGRTVSGILRPISDAESEIVVSATEVVRFRRSEVEEQAPSRTSIMPAGLHEALSPGEMADLIAFLGGFGAASVNLSPRGGQSSRDPKGDPPRRVPAAHPPARSARRAGLVRAGPGTPRYGRRRGDAARPGLDPRPRVR